MRDTSRRIRRMRREKAARAYRRMVLTRLAVLIAVLAVVATAGVSAITTAFARDTGMAYETVIAQKGDTLWSIAQKYNYADRDIRTMVDKIMRVNDMQTADIRVGDRINIPLY